MKNTLYFILIALLPATACNKDKGNSSPIIARWRFNPSVRQSFLNGNSQPSGTQSYEATDYIEFKADGTAESRALSRIETFPYSLVNDTTLIVNGRKTRLNTLTSATLSYTFTDTTNANFYTKFTYNLYK